MAIDASGSTGHTLLWHALAQNDVDMQHHQLLNLDTSNLPLSAAPPTVHPPANQWLHDWDNPSRVWTATQPNFSHLAGSLTIGAGGQQRAITELGTIGVGTWQASVITAPYLTTLDLIRAPLSDVNLNQHKLINVANPVNPQDAVNMQFMDSMLLGLNPKPAVRLASTTSITIRQGTPMVDGIQTVINDRVLVKNEVGGRALENGIYVVSSGNWPRATDCSDDDPANPGTNINRAFCTVLEGSQSGTKWVESAVVATINTSPVAFVLFTDASSGGAPGPPGPPGQGVPVGGSTHQVLRKIDGTNYNTEWANPSITQGVYSTLQTGLIQPTGGIILPTPPLPNPGAMMGLAGYIIPQTSGKVIATVAGFIYNNNASGSGQTRLCFGTGTAPLNNAPQPAGTSTLLGASPALGSLGASRAVPFCVTGVITGLPLGIQIWFDLWAQALVAGTIFMGNVSVTSYEIP